MTATVAPVATTAMTVMTRLSVMSRMGGKNLHGKRLCRRVRCVNKIMKGQVGRAAVGRWLERGHTEVPVS